MAGLWIDLKGPIIGTTAYDEGKLVGKDVTITLPSVTPVTADFRAMGTLTLPLPGQIEAMEASITKIGVDNGLRSLVKLQSKTLEFIAPSWRRPTHTAPRTTREAGRRSTSGVLADVHRR